MSLILYIQFLISLGNNTVPRGKSKTALRSHNGWCCKSKSIKPYLCVAPWWRTVGNKKATVSLSKETGTASPCYRNWDWSWNIVHYSRLNIPLYYWQIHNRISTKIVIKSIVFAICTLLLVSRFVTDVSVVAILVL